jgi:hypothetical protein
LGIACTYGRPGPVFTLDRGRWDLLPASLSTLVRSGLLGAGDEVARVRLLAAVSRLQPRAHARMTVQEWLDRVIAREPVRRVIAAGARTLAYSAALDLVSAELYLDRLQR